MGFRGLRRVIHIVPLVGKVLFKAIPSDFTFNEMERLLGIYGYEISSKGRTSGSRVIFKNESGSPIMLHKPHPWNIIKEYALKQVYEELKNRNLI